MNFEEWYKETYDPNYGKEHKEWELKTWNAAIDEAVNVADEHHLDTNFHGWTDHPNISATYTEDIADKIKELKE